MADELDIVVGVKVDADAAKIQNEIRSKTKNKIKVDLHPTLSDEATSKLSSQINKAVQPNHIRVSIDGQSLNQAREQVRSIFNGVGNLNDIVSRLFNTTQFERQAERVGRAMSQAVQSSTQAVADVMQNMNPSNYALRGTQDLLDLMQRLGVEADRASRVIDHLQGSGVFKPTKVSWKTGQRKYTTEEEVPVGKNKTKKVKTHHVDPYESLQGLTVEGLDANGQAVTRSFKLDQQTNQFVATTVGVMQEGAARVEREARSSGDRIRTAVSSMQSTMQNLFSEAFNQGGNRLEGTKADQFRQQYNTVWQALAGDNINVADMQQRVAGVRRLLKELQSQQKAVNELANKSVSSKIASERTSVEGKYKADTDSIVSRLQGIGDTEQANAMTTAYANLKQLRDSIAGKGAEANATDWASYTRELEKFNDTLAVSKTRYSDLKKAMTTGDKANLLIEGFGSKEAQANQLIGGLNLQGLTEQANNVSAALTKLKTARDNLSKSKSEGNIQAYNTALTEMNNALQTNKRLLADTEKMNKQREMGLSEITKIQNQWTKAMQNTNNVAKLNGIKAMFESGDINQIRQATIELQTFKAEMRATGQAGLSAGDQLKKAFNFIGQAFSGAQLFQYVRQFVSQSVQSTAAVDKSMTSLRKVTDGTAAEYNQFLDDAEARAQKLSTTLTGLIDSTTQFGKLGYSLSEAADLGAISQMYANVGDIDSAETAANYLISTLNGFHLATNDAMSIIDKFNLVENNFSVTASGLGQGLARSAASLYTSNTSLEKSIALMTAANTVVQDEAMVGNALKTLSARIRASKTELAELGEEQDEFASSTSKLRGKIMELTGVDIMVDNNTFKDLYDILGEISQVYDQLTDTSKANVQEILFGKICRWTQKYVQYTYLIAGKALESYTTILGKPQYEGWKT